MSNYTAFTEQIQDKKLKNGGKNHLRVFMTRYLSLKSITAVQMFFVFYSIEYLMPQMYVKMQFDVNHSSVGVCF